jgi:hypothetical protein
MVVYENLDAAPKSDSAQAYCKIPRCSKSTMPPGWRKELRHPERVGNRAFGLAFWYNVRALTIRTFSFELCYAPTFSRDARAHFGPHAILNLL